MGATSLDTQGSKSPTGRRGSSTPITGAVADPVERAYKQCAEGCPSTDRAATSKPRQRIASLFASPVWHPAATQRRKCRPRKTTPTRTSTRSFRPSCSRRGSGFACATSFSRASATR